jgi:hypothetical protein
MIAKVFVGGWEQTGSITVQCLLNPGDSILNDSTNDFQIRSALLTLLDSAHPEVEPGFGYDSTKGRGIMHEIQAVVWKLPGGGGYMLTPYEDVDATECTFTPVILQLVDPPVPGAVPIGRAHTHQTPINKPIYGCPPFVSKDGDTTFYSKFPGDTANGKGPLIKIPSGSVNGGSVEDWLSAMAENKPWYVLEIDGTISVLDNSTIIFPRIYNWDKKRARKCAWTR